MDDGVYTIDEAGNLRKCTTDEGARWWFERGQRSEKREDFVEAIKCYTAGLAAGPDGKFLQYYLRNNLGFCYNVQGNFKEAEQLCKGAIQIDPKTYNAWKNLGVSLESQGLYVSAAMCYVRAIILSNGESRSHAHLKKLLQQQPVVEQKLRRVGIYFGFELN